MQIVMTQALIAIFGWRGGSDIRLEAEKSYA